MVKGSFERVLGVTLLVSCMSFCVYSQSKPSKNSKKLDGVYEFVSESSKFTEPTSESEYLDSEHWMGIWIFQDGYFSKA